MSEEEVNEVIPHEEWVKNFNETISEYGTLRDFPIPCILCAAEDKGANIETIVCSDCQKKCHVCGIQVEENDDDKGEEMPLSILQCTRCKVGFYCGRKCQKEDWPKHKEFCKISDLIKRNYIYRTTVARADPEVDHGEDIKELADIIIP